MRLENTFKSKRPVLSFEIFPPKREEELKNIDATLAILSELRPDFISVTFGAGGSTTNSLTVELAKKIKYEYNIEPLVHLTCLSYSKEEISSILKELEEAGIKNVLALRGDKNPNVESKKDFNYASELTSFIKEYGDFAVAGACYPETHLEAKSPREDIANLKTKVDKGMDFLISQLFFDNIVFYDFVKRARAEGINIPIEAGIMPVINKAQIERMVSLCGVQLPEKFRKVMNKYENDKEALFEAGMAYATSQIVELLSNDIDGIHIFTMNNPVVVKRICEGIKSLIK